MKKVTVLRNLYKEIPYNTIETQKTKKKIMKTKNLVSLLAIALLILSTVTLTSCGGEDEDPKPVVEKTDLEKAQEAVAGSVWVLQDAKITTASEVITYAGDCDFSQFGDNTALATTTNDFKYTFAADGTLSYEEQCGSQSKTGVQYTVTQSGDVFTITYKHGSQDIKFEILNDLEDMEDAEITVKRTTQLVGGATEIKLTFIRS